MHRYTVPPPPCLLLPHVSGVTVTKTHTERFFGI